MSQTISQIALKAINITLALILYQHGSAYNITYQRCCMQPSPNKQSTTSEDLPPRKNKYEFNLQRGRILRIQSDFDNGNIALVRQVTQLQYRLQAVSDYKASSNSNPTGPKKTWFHFRACAVKGIRVRLIIENVSIYQNMYEDKDWAKPVMNDGSGWKQVKDSFLTYRGEVGIIIDHTFASENFVYFAMAVPHSYCESEEYLKQLAFRIPDYIQYEDEIICKSYGGLNLHLIKLTAKQAKSKQGNSSSGNLLTLKQAENPQKNIRVHSQASIESTLSTYLPTKKPVIFITSRVHPGEVGSSHCLIGIIDFLIGSHSLQAYLLLKMFEIMIIPIVNPDGVFDGNYRMDLNNTNLNRVYLQPSPQLHPTVYKIKQIIMNMINPTVSNNINKDKAERMLSILSRKIMFHFDLHSHSCIKSAFIYGNAFDQIVTQTESQLYCKLLQQNCQSFKYGLSHFGQKHMKMKDKGETLTKEGCARVVISKIANVVYSYTVQTAIFPYLNKQALLPITNQQFKLNDNFHFEHVKIQDLISRYNIKNQLFLDNLLLGHGLMVTILDILEKNPYTRIPNLEESLQNYRRQISQNLLQSQQRFKLLDIKAYQKVRNIARCCKQQFTTKNQKNWGYLANDRNFTNVKWPSCFKMFQISNQNNTFQQDIIKKRNRTKTESNDIQKQVNDFIYPKNMRRRYLNLQTQIMNINQSQSNNKNQCSPSKQSISPRNVQIQLQMPLGNQTSAVSNTVLPEIKVGDRNSMNKIRVPNSNSMPKHAQFPPPEQTDKPFNIELKQAQQLNELKEMKQLQQLQQKQSTKNIVLSFIHEQIQKINTIRKNVQKSMAVQNRLASYKLNKKSSRSTKELNPIGVIGAAGRYGIAFAGNNSGNSSNSNSIQSSVVLTQSKSKKKLLTSMQTCEQIINRRRNVAIQQDQQQQYEQQQGIYYVEAKRDQKQIVFKNKQLQQRKQEQKLDLAKNKKRVPVSLQKIAQYPMYPPRQKQKDPSSIVITSKRQLAKMKFSQIKKKNIIRQDLNHSIKLPQLRCIGSSNHNLPACQNGTNEAQTNFQQSQNTKGIRSTRNNSHNHNGLSINLNVNLNLNVCIEPNSKEMTGRARAATMPDQC